jgi:hypothetical protein
MQSLPAKLTFLLGYGRSSTVALSSPLKEVSANNLFILCIVMVMRRHRSEKHRATSTRNIKITRYNNTRVCARGVHASCLER